MKVGKAPNRFGSIYQRSSDGRWVGTVTVSRPGQPQRRRSVVRKTQGEVLDALDTLKSALKADVGSGAGAKGRDLTVRAYIGEWLVGIESSDLGDRTVRRYRELLQQHIIPEIGGIALGALEARDVKTMLAGLSKKPTRGGRTLSAQTVVHARAALRRALSDAVTDGLIVRNVAGRGGSVRTPKPKRTEIEAMTVEEAFAITDAVRDDVLGPMYRLLLWTGLRTGEAAGLAWADHVVDLDGPEPKIRVRRTYGVVALWRGSPRRRRRRRDQIETSRSRARRSPRSVIRGADRRKLDC